MSRLKCSHCGVKIHGKPASLYWAWFPAPDERVAFKTRSDLPCLIDRYQALLRTSSSTSTDDDTCLACGGSSEPDEVVVYLNLYLPKQEVRTYELLFDAQCAAMICGDISEIGERLPDRGARDGGPAAPHTDPWADLEL